MHSYDEKYEIINREILKRRNKWQLTSLSYMDFDDVAQEIRTHIYLKWDLWDQDRPLENWVNTVISHKISNLIRDHYGNVAPPCNGPPACKFDEGGDRCGFTNSGQKCVECPLYAKWVKKKRDAYNLKLASSTEDPDYIENAYESTSHEDHINYEDAALRLHEKMKRHLTSYQYSIYSLLYVEGRSEMEVAELMGLRTSEKNRQPGYKQLHNIKRTIEEKARAMIEKEDVILNV